MVGTELLNPGVPEFDGALDEFIIDVQGVSDLLKQFFFTFVEITVDGGDIDQAFQYVFGVLLGKPDWSDWRDFSKKDRFFQLLNPFLAGEQAQCGMEESALMYFYVLIDHHHCDHRFCKPIALILIQVFQ